jgi:hypothetical protein
MAIDPVATETSPALQSNPPQAPSKSVNLPQPVPDAAKMPQSADQVLLSQNHDRKYQELQQKNERSNAVAGAIRNTDRSLHVLGQKIDEMKAPLVRIVKNFPPFAPEDQARMKLFMKYASLRKEIEELTFPAPPEVVKARKAEALPPPLPGDANDSQIADHVAKLDATSAALSGTRAGLAADTAVLVHDGRFAELFSRPNGAPTGLSEVPLTETGAQQKSAHVGRQFATEVSQGVTAASSQFLKGLS